MSALDHLLEHWQKFDPNLVSPHVHPADQSMFIGERELDTNAPSDIFKYGRLNGIKFRMLPSPFVGDVRNSSIIICLLNPGYDFDPYPEDVSDCFRLAQESTLNQTCADRDFPFIFLDPQFCTTGGFKWWYRKLGPVIFRVQREADCSELEAMRWVSKCVCAVELFPYASKSFDHRYLRPDKRCASVSLMLAAIREIHERQEKLILVTRQIKSWGLDAEDSKMTLLFSSAEARQASLKSRAELIAAEILGAA